MVYFELKLNVDLFLIKKVANYSLPQHKNVFTMEHASAKVFFATKIIQIEVCNSFLYALGV